MANSPQAKKRARQAEKPRALHASPRSNLRPYLKTVIAAISNNDLDASKQAYQKTASVIDSAVSKGLIHKNKAARSKSRLNAKVRTLATAK
jgi:small subunit ribosomal protein S20